MLPNIEPLHALIMFVLSVAIGQTLFASILLFGRSVNGNIAANKFLGFFMLGLCTCLTLLFLFDFWLAALPHVILLNQPIVLCLAPFLYFYVLKVSDENAQISHRQILLHMLPALTVLALLLPFYILPGIEKIEWQFRHPNDYIKISWQQAIASHIRIPTRACAALQGLMYGFLSLRLIAEHRKKIVEQYSYSEGINLSWLRTLIYTCLVGYIVYFVTSTFIFFDKQWLVLWIGSVFSGCALISSVAYFGIAQRKVTQIILKDNESVEAVSEESDEQKYQNSSLSSFEIEKIKSELYQYLETEKPYRDPELTIKQLADSLDVAPRDLSRVINGKIGMNFMELVNHYRIREAKEILVDFRRRTVLEIAYEVGFNSKTAFYEAFKRETDMTPTRYRKITEDNSNAAIAST